MSKYNLSKILPHKPPMILLDDVINYNLEEKTLTALLKISDDSIFFDRTINGIDSMVGLEFMAQAIACYSYFDEGVEEPKPGLLLGTRLFNNSIDKFNNDEEYYVIVHEAFSDEEIYAFDCKITDKYDNEIQSACIKVYKGENIEELLK